MGALLERRFAAGSPMASQIARLAKQLPGDHPRLEMVRFSFGVRQIALASSCRRLDLGSGAKAVLVVGVAEGSRESLGTRAERLADTIAGEEGLAAVLDADGKVLGASGGFDVLSPASAEIDALIGELVDRDRRVVKRALAVNGGVRPAGVVRVPVGDDHLFVLFVGPEERAADHEPVGKPAEFPVPSLRRRLLLSRSGRILPRRHRRQRRRRLLPPSRRGRQRRPRRERCVSCGRAMPTGASSSSRASSPVSSGRTAPSAGRPLATSTGVFISIPTDGSARRSSGARAGAASPSGGRSRARTNGSRSSCLRLRSERRAARPGSAASARSVSTSASPTRTRRPCRHRRRRLLRFSTTRVRRRPLQRR